MLISYDYCVKIVLVINMYFDDLKIGMSVDTEPTTIKKDKMIAFAKDYDNIPLLRRIEPVAPFFAKRDSAAAVGRQHAFSIDDARHQQKTENHQRTCCDHRHPQKKWPGQPGKDKFNDLSPCSCVVGAVRRSDFVPPFEHDFSGRSNSVLGLCCQESLFFGFDHGEEASLVAGF